MLPDSVVGWLTSPWRRRGCPQLRQGCFLQGRRPGRCRSSARPCCGTLLWGGCAPPGPAGGAPGCGSSLKPPAWGTSAPRAAGLGGTSAALVKHGAEVRRRRDGRDLHVRLIRPTVPSRGPPEGHRAVHRAPGVGRSFADGSAASLPQLPLGGAPSTFPEQRLDGRAVVPLAGSLAGGPGGPDP